MDTRPTSPTSASSSFSPPFLGSTSPKTPSSLSLSSSHISISSSASSSSSSSSSSCSPGDPNGGGEASLLRNSVGHLRITAPTRSEDEDGSTAAPISLEAMRRMKQVGKYYLIKSLGEGSFGKVKLAINSETKEKVAIKVLKKSVIQAEGMIQTIKQEIATLKMVHHKNVVNLIEVLSSPEKLYMVLELIRGGELFWHIVSEGRLAEDVARGFFQQLIMGLEYCHSVGVCHRDLKPENILLTEDRVLKISDFGLSSLFRENGQEKFQKTSCGTLQYAAPEILFPHLRPKVVVDQTPLGKKVHRMYKGSLVDIWSAGCILYVMLTGAHPFESDDENEIRSQILNDGLRFPDYLSAGSKALLKKILVVHPDTRASIHVIKNDPWFRVGFEQEGAPTPVRDHLVPTEDSIERSIETVEDQSFKVKIVNAFDLINLLGPKMSTILRQDSGDLKVASLTRFTSKLKPREIISRIQAVLNQMTVGWQLTKDKIRVTTRSRGGLLIYTIDLLQIPPGLVKVNFTRRKGAIADFYSQFQFIKAKCNDIIYLASP